MPRAKTEIKKFMEKHEVTIYALLQEMKLDPVKNHTSWGRKLNGTSLVTEVQLTKLVKALEKITGQVFIVKYIPIKYKLN